MDVHEGLKSLQSERLLVIARGLDQKQVKDVASALYTGGVRVVEITLNTEHSLVMIDELRAHFVGRLFVGAGTVTDLAQAQAAIAAGAQFLVTPHTDVSLIRYAVEQNVPIFPGACTPTEIVTAWQAGATAVKLFPMPADALEWIRQLQGPFDAVKLIALGGIDADNVAQYVRLGCYAVGVGGSILHKQALAANNYEEITRRATVMVNAIKSAQRVE